MRLLFAVTTCWLASGAQDAPVRLSLKGAVEMALAPQGNTRLRTAREALHGAQARASQARAALLPDVSASLAGQSLTRNLAALGVRLNIPVPGFRFPEHVGPFNVFDARTAVTQSVLDAGAIRRYQAARLSVEQARAENESAAEQTASLTAHAYLAAQRAGAGAEAALANAALAEALLRLAEDRKEAGAGLAIEVTRARVHLSTQRQQLVAARNSHHGARLQLLKLLGAPLDRNILLSDPLAYTPLPAPNEAEAIEAARAARADLKAQRQSLETARLRHSAAALERLPSLTAFADYGAIGSGVNHAAPTRTYGLALRIPVYDGGRRDARRAESASQLTEARLRTLDLEQQTALDVRLALDALQSADSLVKAAEEGLDLAAAELEQARRRYEGGVATNIEVTGAQTHLERARENRIQALYLFNVARVDLGAAMGAVIRYLP